MDARKVGPVTIPESLLLERIEQELAAISEEQHARARQVLILRKARTLLHVGCSAFEVNAMLTEQLRKESAHRGPSGHGQGASPAAPVAPNLSWDSPSTPLDDRDLIAFEIPVRASR